MTDSIGLGEAASLQIHLTDVPPRSQAGNGKRGRPCTRLSRRTDMVLYFEIK
jgi:hypothetical protein